MDLLYIEPTDDDIRLYKELIKGYDIIDLSTQCRKPYYHSSDEEYTDSDEEDIEKLT